MNFLFPFSPQSFIFYIDCVVVGGEGEVREMVGVGPGVGEASWFFFLGILWVKYLLLVAVFMYDSEHLFTLSCVP